MAEARGPGERLTLTLKQSLALAERVYGECALIAANRDLSPVEAEIAREAAKLAWVEVRSARKALAIHDAANGQDNLSVNQKRRPGNSAEPGLATSPRPRLEDSLSQLSDEQLKAAWIQGQTLAALSLAQQESAKAGEPMPSAGMNKSETLGKSINGMTKSKLATKTRKVLRILVGLIIGGTVIFLAQGTLLSLFYFFYITTIGQYIFVIGLIGGSILANNPGIAKALMRFWKWMNF